MAEQQTNKIAAAFPAPPPFYKHFTPQNAARLRQLRKETPASQGDDQNAASLNVLALPTELRYLVPPVPPVSKRYRTFGTEIDLDAPDATLEQAGIEQLYPSDPAVKLNPQPHLLALTRSLLTTFLSLVGVLAQNPTEYYEERVESLQTIMFNIHDLINQYRPHQARETLLLLMEERMEKMRDEMQRIAAAKSKAEDVLAGLQRNASDTKEAGRNVDRRPFGADDSSAHNSKTWDKRRAKQKAAWGAIEEVMADPT